MTSFHSVNMLSLIATLACQPYHFPNSPAFSKSKAWQVVTIRKGKFVFISISHINPLLWASNRQLRVQSRMWGPHRWPPAANLHLIGGQLNTLGPDLTPSSTNSHTSDSNGVYASGDSEHTDIPQVSERTFLAVWPPITNVEFIYSTPTPPSHALPNVV